jgi:SAM-dependent methyltransferase
MRLSRTQRHWNRFARADPFWAVLTAPDKKDNRWQVEEFFRTGVDSVAKEIRGVQARCPRLQFGRALDFGCGVGRLSQALAGHFAEVVGVDISEEMLALARRHNRHGDRVTYLHNTRGDLRLLATGRFDFVYSIITLQHMAPVYAKRYIAEFVRVAAPGGVILFQVPVVAPVKPKGGRPFTLWPDTLVKRLYRDIRTKLTAGPLMEMHAIPRAEVEAALHHAGAEVVHVYRYDAAGDTLPGWGYLARKP